MDYFSGGSTKYKLILLLFLDELAIEVTREQITTAVATYDLIPYFELQNAVYELEEDALLAAVPRDFGMAYCVTPKGRETIALFRERLPFSEREHIANYADMCRADLRRKTQYTHRMEKLQSGLYRVVLRAIERDGELFSVSLKCPDSKTAKKVCEAWEDNAAKVYDAVMGSIL